MPLRSAYTHAKPALRPEQRWISIPICVAIALGAAVTAWQYAHREEYSVGDWLDAMQSLLTSLALLIGGTWFLKRRGHFPRAEISHTMFSIQLEGRKLLVVQTKITNKGDLKIDLKSGMYQIRPVPWDGKPLDAGLLVEADDPREVEGGESEEVWKQIELAGDAKNVSVYTCLRNPFRDDDTCWDKETYFSVAGGKILG